MSDDVFRIDFDEIRDRASNQWPAIISHFCPSLADLAYGREKGSFCPFHGGDSGDAFHLLKDFAEVGGCGCNSCGEFARGFDFIARLNNLTIEKAYQAVAQFILSPAEYGELNQPKFKRRGRPPGSKNKPKGGTSSTTHGHPAANGHNGKPAPSEEEVRAAKIRLGQRWQETRPDTGRIKAYLVSRGLAIDPPPTLRFHDSLYFTGKAHNGEEVTGNFPAMVARMEDANTFVARHCTWLSTATDGKLEVKDAKKFNDTIHDGATKGASIRLFPAVEDKPLFIAEGIETCLAIRQAFMEAEVDIPVWAAGSSNHIANIQVPPKIKTVVIWPDRGDESEKDSTTAADRLTREGHIVHIIKLDPSTHAPKTDSLDILIEPGLGASYLRRLWEDAQRAVPHVVKPSWEGKDPKELTDVELANLVLPLIKPHHRRVEAWNCWMSWDGYRWTRNAGRLLRESLQSLGINGGEGHPLQSTNRINKVITELSAKSELNVDYIQFDQRHNLLNCLNGTIDLRTGNLMPHDPENLLTHLVSHNYDPSLTDTNTHCPNWINTLTLTWPPTEENPDRPSTMSSFFQRLCGYTLTGSTQEQIITILHGAGSNGKSTIVDLIQQIMGEDITITLPSSLVTVRREEHPTALASLFNRRMAYSVETGEQAKLNEESMKRLSGSDRILARRMNENFWEFKPTHKVWIATNHKPKIQGTDHAIWRRLVLIPFEQTYWSAERGETGQPEYQQIKDYDKVLQGEIMGIFAWMVRGAVTWFNGGLKQPHEVTVATQQYREEEDLVGQFIAECCVVNSSLSVKSSEMFRAWSKWCENNGEHPRSNKYLSQKIQEKGFQNIRTMYFRGFQGVGIKSEFTNGTEY